MSLRQTATQAAASKRDADRAAAAAAREKELADRHAFVVATLTPLVTADDVTMVTPDVKVPFLRQKRSRDSFDRHTQWEVVEIDGTTFLADDLEIFVWRKDYRELKLHVLVGCATCGDPTLPTESTYGPSQFWPGGTDDDYRRTEIAKRIGETLAARWLCARHKAAQIDARCESCGRPFWEEYQ